MTSNTRPHIDSTLISLKTKKKKYCPICKRTPNPAYNPFCSSRCKDIDLGNWVSENYYIPGPKAFPEGARSPDEENEN